MKIIKGFLYDNNGVQVPYHPTPNRGGVLFPEYGIMHFTADTSPQQTIGWFMKKEAQASAQILVDRAGKAYQFTPLNVVAWHAGKSQWGNINGLNPHSIGIELTNAGRLLKTATGFICQTDKKVIPANEVVKLRHKNETTETYWQTFTEIQLQVAAEIMYLLRETYHLKGVLGHDDIAPGRKADPGPAFDMIAFRRASGFVDANIKHTSTDLNMRGGPGTDHRVLAVLQKGTEVEIISNSGAWSKVNVTRTNPQLTGFVNNNFLI